MATSLSGLKVLVVEDETVVAMLLEQMLEDLGCTVVGMAGHLSVALEQARVTDAQVVILDMNLGGERVDPVAHILVERGLPFVFASGYGEDGLAPEWRGRPVLAKPFRLDQLKDKVEQAVADHV